MRIFRPIIILVIICLLRLHSASDTPRQDDCPKKVLVTVSEVVPTRFIEVKEYTKQLVAKKETFLTAPAAGVIDQVFVKAGQIIAPNTEIAKIKSENLEKEMKSLHEELTKWERILKKRKKWKIRSDKAEAQAGRYIERTKEKIEKMEKERSKLLITSFEGGVIEYIVSKGTQLSLEDPVCHIQDISSLVIPLSKQEKKLLKTDQEVPLEIKTLSSSVPGKAILTKKESKIVVENRDMDIKPGLLATFRLVEKIHKHAVTLPKDRIRKDSSGSYVFLVIGRRAVKQYIKPGAAENGNIHIKKGLSPGDQIITAELDSPASTKLNSGLNCVKDGGRVVIMVWDKEKEGYSKRLKSTPKAVSPATARKARGKSGIKKILSRLDFELAPGIASIDISDLGIRANGIGNIIQQYSDTYENSITQSGTGPGDQNAFPLNFTVKYPIRENIALHFGLEYGRVGGNYSQSHIVTWSRDDITEITDVDTNHELNYIFPYAGFEYRFNKFAVYLDCGASLVNYNYGEDITFRQEDYRNTIKTDIQTSAKNLALIIGTKYTVKISSKIQVLARLEYFYSKIDSFSGDKTVENLNSSGETLRISGDLYRYEINPYQRNWIPYWDLLSSTETGQNARNHTRLGLDLSGLRLMVGIGF